MAALDEANQKTAAEQVAAEQAAASLDADLWLAATMKDVLAKVREKGSEATVRRSRAVLAAA